MKVLDQETFTLDNFEGPLDLLVHLIQQKELDIYEVSLIKITEQYIEKLKSLVNLEGGAEFIGITSFLLWLKSRTLLPTHEQAKKMEEEDTDPRFEMIHQLLDYCQFRDVAKVLTDKDRDQHAYFTRGGESFYEMEERMGVDHLSIYDLAALFQDALSKAKSSKGTIKEEEWLVADQLALIRSQLKMKGEIPIISLLRADCHREELIVIFLAILELMKLGVAVVIKVDEVIKLSLPTEVIKKGI